MSSVGSRENSLLARRRRRRALLDDAFAHYDAQRKRRRRPSRRNRPRKSLNSPLEQRQAFERRFKTLTKRGIKSRLITKLNDMRIPYNPDENINSLAEKLLDNDETDSLRLDRIGSNTNGMFITRINGRIRIQVSQVTVNPMVAKYFGISPGKQYVGEGGYGYLRFVVSYDTETEEISLGVVKKQNITENQRRLHEFEDEVRLQNTLGQAGVVVEGSHFNFSKGKFYIFMKFLPNGDMHKKISRLSTLPINNFRNLRREIFLQSLRTVAYMEQQRLFHRDIKPENFLLDNDFNLRIADLGIATDQHITFDTPGTREYMPPEALIAEQTRSDYDPDKMDAFALGVLGVELFYKFFERRLPGLCRILFTDLDERINFDRYFQRSQVRDRIARFREPYRSIIELLQVYSRRPYAREILERRFWNRESFFDDPSVKMCAYAALDAME